MKRKAAGALIAQVAQAGISLVVQICVARLLGIDAYGEFAILYGIIVLATAAITGIVGDSLVVLDRAQRNVRAGLQITLAVGLLIAGGVSFFGVWLTGFADAAAAGLFASALVAFALEEVVRRLLMAHMRFTHVALADIAGFAVAAVVVALCWIVGIRTLEMIFGGIAVGQLSASWIGWRLLPAAERRFVSIRNSSTGTVWRYGVWRGLLQMLRPAMLTVTRLMVLVFSGAYAVGLLEAARAYTSPLLLIVGGLSSFLFVKFANQARSGRAGSIQEADRMVVLLICLATVAGAVALVLAPWMGPLLFGTALETVAVVAWLVYGVTVAMVTPYGALNAVSGRQVGVFAIRVTDTVLGIGLAGGLLALGVSFAYVPLALAVSSVLGGICMRWLASRRPSGPADGHRG